MKRNMSIELLRAGFMFGIVCLHVITQSGHFADGGIVARRLINIFSPCVEGFVFISGYFGIRLRVEKILKLLALQLFYVVLLSWPYGWRAVVSNATHNWFLFGYIVLMLLSPALNAALENKSKAELLHIGLPIVFAVYGWSYLCVIPGVKDFVPSNYGFAPLSFFYNDRHIYGGSIDTIAGV